MKNKMIKIFLGGYVNSINAQNLNCRALAAHLDAGKFRCGVMTIYSGSLSMEDFPRGVKIFSCRWPHRCWKYITYLRGILWSDVVYLPKGELVGFNARLLRWFGKKSFTTVEGVIDGTNYTKSLRAFGTDEGIRRSYAYTDCAYSITRYMQRRNKELRGIESVGVLYLGVEAPKFSVERISSERLANIVFVGNNMRYKGITDVLDLAGRFGDITFHIVGGGMGYDVEKEVAQRCLGNVKCHGLLNHEQLKELLAQMDLHIFPSRSEGFPKVTLETAAAGVPSVVYGDYGASEWITTGKDGFVVDTPEEMAAIVDDLRLHPEKLTALSRNAAELSRRFDWSSVIKAWEAEIERLYGKE